MMKKVSVLLSVLILLLSLSYNIAEERPVIFSDGLNPQSYVWQIEEFAKWLIRSRDLIPRPSECKGLCFVLDRLVFSGSLEDNEIYFSLEGSLLTDMDTIIPLFGPPQRFTIEDVTINNREAITGFDNNNYFSRVSDRNFLIKGKISFINEVNLTVAGPVNTLINEMKDANITQGNKLAGIRNRLINFQSTKIDPVIIDRPEIKPVFQINRAIRISNDINFEYFVYIRSATEISNYIIPLRNSEVILQVLGADDYKIEDNKIIINSQRQSLNLRIIGKLDKLADLKMDDRSNYEWWLIESDPQHKINVKTQANQIDSSESPMQRTMSLSRLFFLSKGHTVTIEVEKLSSLEALAVIMHSQSRKIIWTKDGDLVSQDTFTYENSGIDYLVFDTGAKPIYLEVNRESQRLFSLENIPKTAIVLPLEKGRHSASIQSLGKEKISFFAGRLRIPFPEHNLTISKGSIDIGLPRGIIPIYLTEGYGFINPFYFYQLIFFIIIIIISWIFYKKKKEKIIAIISFTGLFALFDIFFIIIFLVGFLISIFKFIKKRYSKNKFILTISIFMIFIFLIFIYLIILPSFGVYRVDQIADGAVFEKQVYAPPPPSPSRERRVGQRPSADYLDAEMDYDAIRSEERVISDSSIMEGIIPVALPMPGYDRILRVQKELITSDRPMKPVLYYLRNYSLIPVFLIWLISLILFIRIHLPSIKSLYQKAFKQFESS